MAASSTPRRSSVCSTSGGADDSWIAILDDGKEVALVAYYSAPGRIERDLPHLLSASTPVVVADCGSEACCCGEG
jgi:hypothetical protein